MPEFLPCEWHEYEASILHEGCQVVQVREIFLAPGTLQLRGVMEVYPFGEFMREHLRDTTYRLFLEVCEVLSA